MLFYMYVCEYQIETFNIYMYIMSSYKISALGLVKP